MRRYGIAMTAVLSAALVAGALGALAEPCSAHGRGDWAQEAVVDTAAVLRVSIDFDPPNQVRRADPAVNTFVDAYIVLEGGNPGNLPGGLRTLTLRLGVTEKMSSDAVFESLLPGTVTMGDWRDGLMLASAPCAATDPVVIGVLRVFYRGEPGEVTILEHPDYAWWAVDCDDEAHVYAIGSHGGVHCDPPVVEERIYELTRPVRAEDEDPSHDGHDEHDEDASHGDDDEIPSGTNTEDTAQ